MSKLSPKQNARLHSTGEHCTQHRVVFDQCGNCRLIQRSSNVKLHIVRARDATSALGRHRANNIDTMRLLIILLWPYCYQRESLRDAMRFKRFGNTVSRLYCSRPLFITCNFIGCQKHLSTPENVIINDISDQISCRSDF